MVRKRARVVWYSVCGIALSISLLLAFVLVISEERKSDEPLARPDALEVAWSFRTPGRALDARDLAPEVTDRMLAIPQGKTLSIVDTSNGRLLSTVRSSADEFDEVGFSGGVVIAVDSKRSFKDSMHAYDPATGQELWHKTAIPGGHQARKGDYLGDKPFLPDPGPVIQAAGDEFLGIAPRTGAVRWRMTPTAGCKKGAPGGSSYSVGTTSKHLVLLSQCLGMAAEVKAFDAEDGTIAWKRRLGNWQEILRLGAARNAIGVTLDKQGYLFTESGEEVLRRAGITGPLGEARGLMYFNGVGGGLQAVRADTGKPVWAHSPRSYAGTTLGSEIIAQDVDTGGAYSGDTRWSVGDARSQGPGASDLTDLAGRRTSRVPWPVAGTFVGLSGDLLIVRSEEKNNTRYTALRPGHAVTNVEKPVALAGAKPKDWPDACGLLSAELLSELGRDYVKLPVASSRTALGTELPHPSVCRFVPVAGPDSAVFSVTVRWVAPSAKAAQTYATSGLPWGCHPATEAFCRSANITEPQRGVFFYTNVTGLELIPVANATVVSGRYVFGISAAKDEASNRRLVRRVAKHLFDHTLPYPS
ncbi:PQQ-like beta-propeller repeat protein [Streptomyces sp. NBC_01433]|uniref:outer membrane protein assembly factor BamB family protein n=1 Tax=Streptomyces sp. NBC_01433 TaxID=2903864 RepID=UPI00224CEDBA|nr:PQQ-binding-like beta-propeller repeat protein [Streptomyces sp. NBC_01433]MCX4673782.1 PQQ-like beta-propeller repeat protein [Streptomyces sp. NBC_01433]